MSSRTVNFLGFTLTDLRSPYNLSLNRMSKHFFLKHQHFKDDLNFFPLFIMYTWWSLLHIGIWYKSLFYNMYKNIFLIFWPIHIVKVYLTPHPHPLCHFKKNEFRMFCMQHLDKPINEAVSVRDDSLNKIVKILI